MTRIHESRFQSRNPNRHCPCRIELAAHSSSDVSERQANRRRPMGSHFTRLSRSRDLLCYANGGIRNTPLIFSREAPWDRHCSCRSFSSASASSPFPSCSSFSSRLAVCWPGSGSPRRSLLHRRSRSKHVDFLLSDRQHVSPVLVIELDDSSHERQDVRERDREKDAILQAAGLPGNSSRRWRRGCCQPIQIGFAIASRSISSGNWTLSCGSCSTDNNPREIRKTLRPSGGR